MADDSLLFAFAYQVPPLLLGLVLKALIPLPAILAIFVLPGTFVHELLHLLVGLILNGKPVSLSLWPRRVGHGRWILGAVGFANLRWYNAVFIALAPLFAIVANLLLAPSPSGWEPHGSDVQHWLIATPILAMCIPSTTDFKLAFKSWPIFAVVLIWTAWHFSNH